MESFDNYTPNERSHLMMLTTVLFFITAIGVSSYAVDARSGVFRTRASAPGTISRATRVAALLQVKNERHFKVFVLEGITQNGYLKGTLGPVEVVRNGRVSLLKPGDEVQVGDRIRSGRGIAQTISSEGGGFLAFYDEKGEPVAIIGDPSELDVTVSGIGIFKRQMRVPSIQIVNHRSRPLSIDVQQNSDKDHPLVTVTGEDGRPQRSQTHAETESARKIMNYDLYEDWYSRRWERAGRIYELGRNGATREYSAQDNEEKTPSGETSSSSACGVGRTWTEEESGYTSVWTRQGDSDIFDALYTTPGGGKATTRNSVTLDGNKITIHRLGSSDTFLCTYSGTVTGSNIKGTYKCPSAWNGERSWSATINCN